MTTITQAEIEQYRSQLQAYPDALRAIDVLEECEGDLEFAAETVAIETGELADDLGDEDPNEPSWLEKSADQLRPYICTPAFKETFNDGLAAAIGLLTPLVGFPILLIFVLIYISRRGIDEFCNS